MQWRKRHYCIEQLEENDEKSQTASEEKKDKDCNTENTDEHIKESEQKNTSVIEQTEETSLVIKQSKEEEKCL